MSGELSDYLDKACLAFWNDLHADGWSWREMIEGRAGNNETERQTGKEYALTIAHAMSAAIATSRKDNGAAAYIKRALELLSLKTEALDAHTLKTLRRFSMCVSEDIDRVNGQLPSPWFAGLSQNIREAWEELQMADAALSDPAGGERG